MKPLRLKDLDSNQHPFKLDSGESVMIEVDVERPPEKTGRVRLRLRAWQINETGQRTVDMEDGSATIIPVKFRDVADNERLDDEIADAIVTLGERIKHHIEAKKAIVARRALEQNDNDRERDKI